jgi:hypothetical protein
MVGAEGKVVALDISPEMLAVARGLPAQSVSTSESTPYLEYRSEACKFGHYLSRVWELSAVGLGVMCRLCLIAEEEKRNSRTGLDSFTLIS